MYVDPGTSNIVLQVLIGVIVAVPVLLRVFWIKIKGLAKKSEKTD